MKKPVKTAEKMLCFDLESDRSINELCSQLMHYAGADALLFSGEMGSCINLMARLETAFKEAVKLNYCYEHGEQTEDGFRLDEIYEAMMEEEIAMETCVYFFFEDDCEDEDE